MKNYLKQNINTFSLNQSIDLIYLIKANEYVLYKNLNQISYLLPDERVVTDTLAFDSRKMSGFFMKATILNWKKNSVEKKFVNKILTWKVTL